MKNLIIVLLLLLLVVLSVLRAGRHFRGGCCGSGGDIREKKALPGPELGCKTMHVEGMHCENCEIRVENALNRLEPVSARAHWRKKQVLVHYCAPVEDAQLRSTVERLGYQVTDIAETGRHTEA